MWHITNLVTHHNYNMSAGQTSTTTHKPLFEIKTFAAFYAGKRRTNKLYKTKYRVAILITSTTSSALESTTRKNVAK